MLPLVDKPLIQYVVEEAVAAGIEEFIVVTGRGKRAIEDHFDVSFELEANLHRNGKQEVLKEMQRIAKLGKFCYVRQSERGVWAMQFFPRLLVGNEPLRFSWGSIIDGRVPALSQLRVIPRPVAP